MHFLSDHYRKKLKYFKEHLWNNLSTALEFRASNFCFDKGLYAVEQYRGF